MRAWMLLVSFIAFPLSVKASTDGPNGPKANITINQDQVNGQAVQEVLAKVQDVLGRPDQRGEFTIQEILSFLPLTDGERDTIVQAHPALVPLTCSGDICTAVSTGDEVYVNLSQMGGVPGWFAQVVTLKLRWGGLTRLELCSIKGMQVKQFFWVPVDGAVLDSEGQQGSSFIDVSVGGAFPSC